MATAIDNELARISQRVRARREQSGLTLQELAKRSGVATSTIQKVETEQMIPSVAILMKIALGLGAAVADLISDAGEAIEISHRRAVDRRRVGRGNIVERLSGDILEQTLDMWRVTVEPGHDSGKESMRFGGDALVVCEEGTLLFGLGEDEYVLSAGDTLHFRATIPYGWRNMSDAPATFTLTGALEGRLREVMQARAGSSSRRKRS
ncbi:MAG: helix-turn-helix transcriptional regulator [Deltaproteobacteria bacterium]|nr:helix-turn-helix transcriptional regulator [Deltaproteobacteria bacterium]MBW2413654.1 helix-turn-helix transcriptional regulator [Deltaproteobacteria bacterium]